jgi:hypothetical protein
MQPDSARADLFSAGTHDSHLQGRVGSPLPRFERRNQAIPLNIEQRIPCGSGKWANGSWPWISENESALLSAHLTD